MLQRFSFLAAAQSPHFTNRDAHHHQSADQCMHQQNVNQWEESALFNEPQELPRQRCLMGTVLPVRRIVQMGVLPGERSHEEHVTEDDGAKDNHAPSPSAGSPGT